MLHVNPISVKRLIALRLSVKTRFYELFILMFYYLLAQLLANKNLYFDNICTEPLIDKIKEMHFLLKSVKKKNRCQTGTPGG